MTHLQVGRRMPTRISASTTQMRGAVSDDDWKDDAARFQEQMRKIMEPMIRMQEAFTPLFNDLNKFALQHREQISAINEQFTQFFEQTAVSLKPFMPGFELLAKAGAQNKRLEKAGFLPHATTLSFAEDETLEATSLSAAIETHYREHWPE